MLRTNFESTDLKRTRSEHTLLLSSGVMLDGAEPTANTHDDINTEPHTSGMPFLLRDL